MAVLSSRMAAVIDSLLALADANLPATTAVVDGPFNASDGDTALATSRLFVGTDNSDSAGSGTAVDGDQAMRVIGARLRDERFSVHCVAEGWDGDGTMKTARDLAIGVLSAVETFMRPTPAVTDAYSLAGATNMWAGIGRETMTQSWEPTGAYCRIDFSVDVRANLNQ